jgi:EPS-associated MarR family transcriptional regulator
MRIQQGMRFKVLRPLEKQPGLSQRQLADILGVGQGKANYLLRALLDMGLLKAHNFRSSQNKLAYAYLITPRGLADKAALTRVYLERKSKEYEALRLAGR